MSRSYTKYNYIFMFPPNIQGQGPQLTAMLYVTATQSLQKWVSFSAFNTLRLRQNGHHFDDDIFKCIIWSENVKISLKISLKFVLKGPINNIAALVQIMAWRQSGDKPLSAPMTASLLTHLCVTWPQWVNPNRSTGWSGRKHNRSLNYHCFNSV